MLFHAKEVQSTSRIDAIPGTLSMLQCVVPQNVHTGSTVWIPKDKNKKIKKKENTKGRHEDGRRF